LGPSLPYSLSAQISLWRSAASLTHQDQAAAAALLQAGLVAAALILWRGVEAAASALRQRMTLNGIRAPWAERIFTPLATAAVVGLIVLPLLGLLGLGLWSVAGLWRFPEALPNQITLQAWASAGPALLDASATSVVLALGVTAVALALTLWALQAEALPPSPRRDGLIFLPLIVPQIVVLPGIATALLHLPMPPFVAVALGHLVYVLPYVVLGLSGPFRSWNPQLGAVGASLGAKPWRVLLRLRLPMLAGPIAATAAVGFAVSVGQYLPTLLLGGGRIVTLTTEAVALSSGGNRRIVGAYGLAQAFWPALAFVLATQIQRARSLSFGPHPR
jgi:putative thiamine transport system permease protein